MCALKPESFSKPDCSWLPSASMRTESPLYRPHRLAHLPSLGWIHHSTRPCLASEGGGSGTKMTNCEIWQNSSFFTLFSDFCSDFDEILSEFQSPCSGGPGGEARPRDERRAAEDAVEDGGAEGAVPERGVPPGPPPAHGPTFGRTLS